MCLNVYPLIGTVTLKRINCAKYRYICISLQEGTCTPKKPTVIFTLLTLSFYVLSPDFFLSKQRLCGHEVITFVCCLIRFPYMNSSVNDSLVDLSVISPLNVLQNGNVPLP